MLLDKYFFFNMTNSYPMDCITILKPLDYSFVPNLITYAEEKLKRNHFISIMRRESIIQNPHKLTCF